MRVTRVVVSLLLGLLLLSSFACGPPSSQNDASGPDGPLEITDETIYERINHARIHEVPEENGTAEPISWSFIQSEPKEIKVVDKKVEGGKATIIVDIKTSSSPRSREQRYLAGRIKTEWQLRSGLVLRQWEIVDTENISMKYRNLPKLPAENSNR